MCMIFVLCNVLVHLVFMTMEVAANAWVAKKGVEDRHQAQRFSTAVIQRPSAYDHNKAGAFCLCVSRRRDCQRSST